MGTDGVKTILPRSGPEEFWEAVYEDFARRDERKWKYLAMLALREAAGWPLEYIGLAFGHPKGHVVRCLQNVKCELQDRFEREERSSEADPPTEDVSG